MTGDNYSTAVMEYKNDHKSLAHRAVSWASSITRTSYISKIHSNIIP